MAISGLLLGVILFALLFNVFRGDPAADGATSTSTTPTTTQVVIADPEPIDVLDETCTPEGIGSLICANLTDGTSAEYQVVWEDVVAEQGSVIIEFTFREPMAISRIEWSNIEDEDRFLQNFRAAGLTVTADDSLSETPVELADLRGTQAIDYISLATTTLRIEIVTAHDAEVVNENIFRELAIAEIVIIGRPVVTTQTTSG